MAVTSGSGIVRAAVFHRVEAAAHAVKELLEKGFSRDEISVICSDEIHRRIFQDYDREHAAGSRTGEAVAAALLVSLGLGAAVLTPLVTAAGVAVAAIGGLTTTAMGASFAAAMMTRGVEKELADYYDQAVSKGDLLVAAERRGADQDEMAARAEAVFTESGSKPLKLSGH